MNRSSSNKIRVLIVGANGFIGRHLSATLAKDKQLAVTLFSRKFSEELRTGIRDAADFIIGDITDATALQRAIAGKDVVYHLVSASVASSNWHSPQTEIEDNLLPSLNLIEICCKEGVKKIVFTSSAGTVYGMRSTVCTENDVLHPYSPYGIIKVTIENFLEHYRVKCGLAYDVYRISNPYGPGLDKQGFGVINTWIKSAIKGKELKIYGDGKASKDYIYIDDVISALNVSLENLGHSNIFNLASGEVSSLNDIIKVIKKVYRKDVVVKYVDGPKSDNKIVRVSNVKLQQYQIKKSYVLLEDGIRRTILHYDT